MLRDRLVCHRRGHLQRMCRSAKAGNSNPSKTPRRKVGVKQVGESEDSESEADDLWLVEEVGGIHKLYQPPIKVPVCVDGVNVCMELDTGASVSIVSEAQYKQWWPGRSLDSSPIKLQTYSKQLLRVLGSLSVMVDYEGQRATLVYPLWLWKGVGPC